MERDTPFIHLFKTPGGYYIYDINTNRIIKTQESVYNYLSLNRGNEINIGESSGNNEYDILIDKMKEKGLLSSNKVKEIIHPEDSLLEQNLASKIKMITLQVTQQCNLRCEYCAYSGDYVNRGHANARMSFETAKKGIDFLISHSKDVDMVNVGFYGGEPLLEFELIKKCVNYTLDNYGGKKITFGMTTNGTLFTKEILDFLSMHDFLIIISLDGPKEIHDLNRKFAAGGCGTFDKVNKNLEIFRESYPEYFKKVRFNVVMDRKNDFSCMNEFFNSDDIFTDLTLNTSDISVNYLKKQYQSSDTFDIKFKYEVFKLYLNKVGKLDKRIVSKLVTGTYNRVKTSFSKERLYTKKLPDKTHHSGPCVPGAQRLFMDVNGNFYPCERVSESSEVMRIGHVDMGFDYEKIRKILNIGKITEKSCINCWAFRFCTLCAASADDMEGLSAEMKSKHCNAVRATQEEALKDYCTLIEFGHSFEENNSYYVLEG
ncbi:Cys-rich peptide radical SAM maturase CcpM [Clostridium sp. BNL1100]|uniref:Cys-rich peptide radical SAM maturase CcpM n=1 Tax=Clostridium sp. BNL1100 TaxID=755731 RepID=UPI00024A7EEC|nr:Cys-rich peptide radical SAM maturase CcpM [Clostridium sp. BNL1100]AEY65013.1 CLI_3235-class bacteriocin maturation radical SAM enzyme [Clostridium sp. BNL1100]